MITKSPVDLISGESSLEACRQLSSPGLSAAHVQGKTEICWLLLLFQGH